MSTRHAGSVILISGLLTALSLVFCGFDVGGVASAGIAVLAALLLLVPALRKRSRSLPRLAAMVVWGMISLGAVMGIAGCGGGFFGRAPQTYTLTITGTSGATTHSTTTTLQVQ